MYENIINNVIFYLKNKKFANLQINLILIKSLNESKFLFAFLFNDIWLKSIRFSSLFIRDNINI